MAVAIVGNGGVIAEVDGATNFRALRTSSRPTEYGALGHYKASMTTGSIAAGAATYEIAQFRNSGSNLCVVQKISIDGIIATTAFAAGQILIRAFAARSFTVFGTTAITAATLTGDNNQMRTSMGAANGQFGVSTTATITGMTRTLDSQAIGQLNTHSSGGVGAATPIIGSIYLPYNEIFGPSSGDGEHPLVCAQNEGFVIQVTVPATGVWIAGITVRWAEVAAY